MPIDRLTAINVRTLPARPGLGVDYTDALLPGFVLRISRRGVRSYGVAKRDGGGKRRVSLGLIERVPLAEARARAREIIEALQRREPLPPAPAQGAPLTVARLVRRCLDDLDLRARTRAEWERIAKVEIIPAIGSRRAAEVRRADLREWAASIRSPWVAQHAVAILRRCYSWGLDQDILEHSPCARILVAHQRREGGRILSTLELAALLRALDRGRRRYPLYADATLLLLLTLVRRSSVLGMRRDELEDLDGEAPRWIIPGARTKGGSDHAVPLSPAAVEVVRRRIAATPKLVHLFPAGHGDARDDTPAGWAGRWRLWLHRRVARALQARQRSRGEAISPVPRWTIHGLRHTAATHLREDLDVPQDVVALLLGHTPPGLPQATPLYLRATLLPERRAALEAWAAWLDRVRCGHATPPAVQKNMRRRPKDRTAKSARYGRRRNRG